jgi:hypothetical protein
MDESCWKSNRGGKHCPNKATQHAHSEMMYTQLCDECQSEWKSLSSDWRPGIDLERQRLGQTFYED